MTSPAITSTEQAPPRIRGSFGLAMPVIVAVAAILIAFGFSGYLVTVFGFAAIYGIFVTGLNFFMGYTGQASFGQNAFAALGGYSSAILTATYGFEPIVALFLAMILSGVVALVVGYPTLRLRGHYLAMATFALGLIVYEIAVEWTSLTQGYMGYSGIPPIGIFGYELTTEKTQLIALAAILLLGVWISSRLRHSRFGRALRAIAGSEQAASALGIKVSRYKLAAFVVAALYASVAGSLFAHFVGFISPEVFGTNMVVLSFTMLYLGGIGSAWGPVIGAVIVSLLPEALRGLKELQDVFYCAILIAILIFLPKGLTGLAALVQDRTGWGRK
ncbi:branched-chain amino acid ABC transporter permease [Microvirga sp. HBU67558]|uniref:branched-chain amino acid ABC transporter permease n=1 Tax=Microvirga TaxID=186650 RepID=UPI001B386C0C|nr:MULTISPECIES: branched-chain amino acid ABC transporter permease [unclassified Microvirga]MBQ0820316.1 branched-chain amino acid ABC transporter permease [Microvirga sp. HBU67558]